MTKFRATSPQDAPVVAALLQRIFEIDSGLPLIDPRHLHWKSWEPRSDWPGSRGYAMTKNEDIVAHGTVVPLSAVSGQQSLKMVHLIDWAADPKSIGSGVALLKQIARQVDAVIVAGGSDMTQKVLPALGFKTCGSVTNFARPLRPLRRLVGEKAGVRLAAKFARSVLWSLQAPSSKTEGWTSTRIAPEQLPSHPLCLPRAGEGTIVERTADLFAYLSKCPVTPMEIYSVAKAGEDRGYFVLAHAPGQVRVVDFYIDSREPSDWRILIQLAISRAAEDTDAAEVVSVGSDSTTRQVLLDSGFHARGDSALRILPAKGLEVTAPVRFHMIDSDAAYLHRNTIDYWA